MGLEKRNNLSTTRALLSFICRREHVCYFVPVIVQEYQHEFSAAQWARLSCRLGIGQELSPLLFLLSVFLVVKQLPVIGSGEARGHRFFTPGLRCSPPTKAVKQFLHGCSFPGLSGTTLLTRGSWRHDCEPDAAENLEEYTEVHDRGNEQSRVISTRTAQGIARAALGYELRFKITNELMESYLTPTYLRLRQRPPDLWLYRVR